MDAKELLALILRLWNETCAGEYPYGGDDLPPRWWYHVAPKSKARMMQIADYISDNADDIEDEATLVRIVKEAIAQVHYDDACTEMRRSEDD
jgi:hypothetical protein